MKQARRIRPTGGSIRATHLSPETQRKLAEFAAHLPRG